MSNPTVTGSYIPSSQVWDVSAIYALEEVSPQLKELLVRMYQNLNNMAVNVNLKDIGYYPTTEFVCGQLYFPQPLNNSANNAYPSYRQVNRVVINFGALPNTTTISVPHNIYVTAMTSFTRIYGAASDPTNNHYVPIPYSSCTAVADNIEINCDANNVNIITGSDRSTYTVCYVVLEFLQS